MISEQLIQILNYLQIEHQAFADLLGVKVQRIRNISAGNVKKWTREETEVLVRKLGISASWLATGLGEMLQSEAEKHLTAKLGDAKDMATLLETWGVTADKRSFLTDVLYAYELGADDELAKLLNGIALTNTDQQTLLANWGQCSPDSQVAIQRMTSELANANTKEKS